MNPTWDNVVLWCYRTCALQYVHSCVKLAGFDSGPAGVWSLSHIGQTEKFNPLHFFSYSFSSVPSIYVHNHGKVGEIFDNQKKKLIICYEKYVYVQYVCPLKATIRFITSLK